MDNLLKLIKSQNNQKLIYSKMLTKIVDDLLNLFKKTEIKNTTEITGFLEVITKRLENKVVKANISIKNCFILIIIRVIFVSCFYYFYCNTTNN